VSITQHPTHFVSNQLAYRFKQGSEVCKSRRDSFQSFDFVTSSVEQPGSVILRFQDLYNLKEIPSGACDDRE
jgi:hypothetical protein